MLQSRNRAVPIETVLPVHKPPVAGKPAALESERDPLPLPTGPAVRNEDDPLHRANQAFAGGDYAEAARLFQELAAKEDRYRTYAGVALFRMKEYESAIQQLEQAVAADPSDFLAHKFLGLAWYLSDHLEKSLEHVRAALALRSDGELESLLAKLEREKPVQDDFVDVEIPYFRILFDGREQRETKRLVIRLTQGGICGYRQETRLVSRRSGDGDPLQRKGFCRRHRRARSGSEGFTTARSGSRCAA